MFNSRNSFVPSRDGQRLLVNMLLRPDDAPIGVVHRLAGGLGEVVRAEIEWNPSRDTRSHTRGRRLDANGQVEAPADAPERLDSFVEALATTLIDGGVADVLVVGRPDNRASS